MQRGHDRRSCCRWRQPSRPGPALPRAGPSRRRSRCRRARGSRGRKYRPRYRSSVRPCAPRHRRGPACPRTRTSGRCTRPCTRPGPCSRRPRGAPTPVLCLELHLGIGHEERRQGERFEVVRLDRLPAASRGRSRLLPRWLAIAWRPSARGRLTARSPSPRCWSWPALCHRRAAAQASELARPIRTNRRTSSAALIAVRTSVNATEIRTIVLISLTSSCSSAERRRRIGEDDPAAQRERDREDRDRGDVGQRVRRRPGTGSMSAGPG